MTVTRVMRMRESNSHRRSEPHKRRLEEFTIYKQERTVTPSLQAGEQNGMEHEHPIDDELNVHDASFRRHYQLNYADEPLDYETYFAPAYRFGYQWTAQSRGAEWDAVEEQAHAEWVANHPISCETVAEAVQYGWQEERDPSEHRVDHRYGTGR